MAKDFHSEDSDFRNPSSEFIKETIEFWKEYKGVTLTEEDAREAIANVTGFFKVLMKWDQEAKLKQSQEQSREQVPESKT